MVRHSGHPHIEEPVRRATWAERNEHAVQYGGLAALGVTTIAVVFLAMMPTAPPTSGALADVPTRSSVGKVVKVGAEVLAANPLNDKRGAPKDGVSYYPTPDQLPSVSFGCIGGTTDTNLKPCTFGKASGASVVLAGDSHAQQWGSALRSLAEKRGWHLTVLTKDFCPLADQVRVSSPWSGSCLQWQAKAVAQLQANPPDLLITSQYDYRLAGPSGVLSASQSSQELGSAQRDLYERLAAKGTKVAVLRNTPQPGINIGDCVSKNDPRLTRCAVPRTRALSTTVGASQAVSVQGSAAKLIDLDDAICPTRQCAPVIGGVLVYSDDNHMTVTYGESLAPRLGRALSQLL